MGRPRTLRELSAETRRLCADTLQFRAAARLIDPSGAAGRYADMLERLREDPGNRTLGQLLQERQWALQEIERLTEELLRQRSVPAPKAPFQEIIDEAESARRAQALRNPNRLIRMKELRQLLGLGHSTLYKMIGEGRFPRPVRLGERAVAWRLADVEAWQRTLG